MKPHEKLDVWQKSIELVEMIYKITKQFPKEEIYGLTTQMRRAVVSVPSNIAEGAARQTKTEFKQFLFIARGSLTELETQLTICLQLNHINMEDYKKTTTLTERISKMLTGLINKIK